MLRLVLDAIQSLGVQDGPLGFLDGSKWYSEALLTSPFRARARADSLAEGFTNADAVIGDFDFRASTKAGLQLNPGCRQFVVVEAKMFSNLSAGTKNAPGYNQAARSVACMAEALAVAGVHVSEIERVGFFVIAPTTSQRGHGRSNLEEFVTAASIRVAVADRISKYERLGRPEAVDLRKWEAESLLPLVDRLEASDGLNVLSWEESIDGIGRADKATGDELNSFYQRCLRFRPVALSRALVEAS